MSDHKSEAQIDDMLDDTFPASDPPSTTPPSGTKKSREIHEANEGAGEAPGRATDDRMLTETAAGRIEGTDPPQHKSN